MQLNSTPHGGHALQRLPESTRERIRKAILVSRDEDDWTIARGITPPVDPDMVAAMRERLIGLGVIEKRPPVRRARPARPSDNLHLFASA